MAEIYNWCSQVLQTQISSPNDFKTGAYLKTILDSFQIPNLVISLPVSPPKNVFQFRTNWAYLLQILQDLKIINKGEFNAPDVVSNVDNSLEKVLTKIQQHNGRPPPPKFKGCRFCQKTVVNTTISSDAERVCHNPECQTHFQTCCRHLLPCGHPCCGMRDETQHLPCAVCDDSLLCCYCYLSLTEKPSIMLKCGHFCHYACFTQYLGTCSLSRRVILPKCGQPGCGQFPSHPRIDSQLAPYLDATIKVQQLTQRQIEIDKIAMDPHVTNPQDRDYYQKPVKYAEDNFIFCICDLCHEIYYAGLKKCGGIIVSAKELLCDKCHAIKYPILNWDGNQKKVPAGFRICPSCKHCVEKSQACNHIACPCGKHFCYYCGAGPWEDSSDCYAHMRQEHGGCSVDPPDYKRFCKGEKVSDQELQAFYAKYPQWSTQK